MGGVPLLLRDHLSIENVDSAEMEDDKGMTVGQLRDRILSDGQLGQVSEWTQLGKLLKLQGSKCKTLRNLIMVRTKLVDILNGSMAIKSFEHRLV